MDVAAWVTLLVNRQDKDQRLPVVAATALLLGLTWGQCEPDGRVTICEAARVDGHVKWPSGQFLAGLEVAERAGWILDLAFDADLGQFRYTLTIPEET